MDLTPIFRVEFFLDAIINSTTPPEPIFRKEFYLAKIAGADVPIPSPVFREEYYLAKLCGEDVEIPEPIFRKEFWLAKKCGEDVTTPTPIFREEYWLEEWVNGSSPQYQTITGRIVSFLTQRIAPLKIEADLEPIQSGTGDPSPDNVRPISGHTGAVVNVSGINLFDKTTAQAGYVDNADGQIKGTTASLNYKCTDYIPVLSGNSYYVKSEQTLSIWGAWYDKDKRFISGITGYVNNVITAQLNACYVRLTIGRDGNGNIDTFGVNYPSTETDYHAYSGTSVTLTFGSTVYGGKLTVNEDGTGTVKARPYYASYNGETLVGPWVSSMDAYAPGTTPTTGAQVVDMGGTETTITLTPGQVNALQGQNVVWVDDSGEIKVTFRSN